MVDAPGGPAADAAAPGQSGACAIRRVLHRALRSGRGSAPVAEHLSESSTGRAVIRGRFAWVFIPGGAALICALYLAFVALRAGDSAHYDVTPLSIGFVLASGVAIASGAVVLLRLRQGSIGPLFALATGALVFAFLALFSIGLLVLPVGLVLLVVALRQLRQRGTPGAARAAVAGAALGIGLIAYVLVMFQPAVAECRSGGGGATSSGGLFGGVSYSSGGYNTATGESGGFIDEGDRIAYFTARAER